MTENENGEVLVRVENVSKKFCRSLRKSLWYGLTDIASELIPRSPNSLERATSADWDESDANLKSKSLRPDEFWAVKDVSFELRRGECLGLIGHNGAGKTTLLKMLNGLIKPDSGRITMRGRVGALIALGAGFNPILTGRENVYVNGSVLGLSKAEIDEKIDDIIDFAEIREFIDTPVQNYSSGMQVRLGFAVATALKPDVLILDEVLAVGDAAFRAKCYNKLATLMSISAVILVTHNLDHISQLCNKCIALSSGMVIDYGSPSGVIRLYESTNHENGEQEGFLKCSTGIRKVDIHVMSEVFEFNDCCKITISLESDRIITDSFVRVALYYLGGRFVGVFNSKNHNSVYYVRRGRTEFQVTVPNIRLKTGKYPISIVLHPSIGVENIFWSYKQFSIESVNSPRGYSDYLI